MKYIVKSPPSSTVSQVPYGDMFRTQTGDLHIRMNEKSSGGWAALRFVDGKWLLVSISLREGATIVSYTLDVED